MKRLLHIALTVGLAVSAAHAQLLFQDPFDSADGPLLNTPGSPWVNNYTPSNQISVVSGELFLTQTQQESVRHPLPTTYAQGNLSASFQLRVTALPTGSGNYFAFFRGTADTLFCRVWIKTNGAAAGKFRLGINVISQAPVMIPHDFSPGETHTLVMRMQMDGANFTGTLWMDPASETDTTHWAEDQQFVGNGFVLAHFGFKQVADYENAASGMGSLFVDNLRVGRLFTDVTPPRFTSVLNLGGSGMKLFGTGIVGTNYLVLANTNLSTADWVNLGTAQAEAGGIIQFTDPAATNLPTRFYRLRAQ